MRSAQHGAPLIMLSRLITRTASLVSPRTTSGRGETHRSGRDRAQIAEAGRDVAADRAVFEQAPADGVAAGRAGDVVDDAPRHPRRHRLVGEVVDRTLDPL